MKVIRTLALCSLLAVAGSAFGADKVCKLEITGSDQMQYDKKELSVAADCTQVELTLHHGGKLPAQAMGHNWVLAKTSDMAGIASDGAARVSPTITSRRAMRASSRTPRSSAAARAPA